MEARDKERLQRNWAKLLDVVYSDISPHLISNFVLTLEMHTDIDSKPTERKKMEKLLGILPTRGGSAFRELINALRPSYSWIADDLEVEHQRPQRPRPQLLPNPPINNNLPDGSIADYLLDLARIMDRCSRVSRQWSLLAHALHLSPSTVQDIKRDMSYSGGHNFAIFTVLEEWLAKVGDSRATFLNLARVLKHEGIEQSAKDILDFWTEIVHRRGYQDSEQHPSPSHRRHRSRSRSPVITDV